MIALKKTRLTLLQKPTQLSLPLPLSKSKSSSSSSVSPAYYTLLKQSFKNNLIESVKEGVAVITSLEMDDEEKEKAGNERDIRYRDWMALVGMVGQER